MWRSASRTLSRWLKKGNKMASSAWQSKSNSARSSVRRAPAVSRSFWSSSRRRLACRSRGVSMTTFMLQRRNSQVRMQMKKVHHSLKWKWWKTKNRSRISQKLSASLWRVSRAAMERLLTYQWASRAPARTYSRLLATRNISILRALSGHLILMTLDRTSKGHPHLARYCLTSKTSMQLWSKFRRRNSLTRRHKCKFLCHSAVARNLSSTRKRLRS